MDANFVIVAALGIFGVLLIICAAIIWRAFEGMKNFLRDNVTEVLIVAGDEIVGRLQNLHNALNSLTANIPQTAQTLDLKKLETELSNLNNAVQETSKILRVIADGIKSLKDETLASQNAIGEKLGNAISQVQTNSNAAPVNDSAILGSIVSELQALKQVAEKISGFCDKNDLNTTISSIISESSGNLQTALVGRLDDIISQVGNKPEYGSSSVNDLSEKIAALSEELGKLPETIAESSGNLQTALVGRLDDIISQIGNKPEYDSSLVNDLSEKIAALSEELGKLPETISESSENLQTTLVGRLDDIISQVGNKPDGDSSSVNDLSEKIAALSEELGKLPEKIQNSAITNFESEIKTFTDTVKNMTRNLEDMNQKQRDLIGKVSKMILEIQSVMTKETEEIQSEFAQTNNNLKGMVASYRNQILEGYEKIATTIFKSIAGNLEAIIRELKQKNGN